MSGHSKWAGIKHKKAANDAKKSQIFGKMAGLIALAARQGGPDTEMNYKLRMIVDKAKAANMPLTNIEKAIQRGAGNGEGDNLEELIIEGLGPTGKAILIRAITDNRNRTVSEIKHLFSKNSGKVVEGNAVKWLFEEKGEIILEKEKINEEEELKIIEAGAEDIQKDNDKITIITKAEDLGRTRNELEKSGFAVKESSLVFIPKNLEQISNEEKEKYENFFEILDDHPDVSDIYCNF